jgi:hypothetical protein
MICFGVKIQQLGETKRLEIDESEWISSEQNDKEDNFKAVSLIRSKTTDKHALLCTSVHYTVYCMQSDTQTANTHVYNATNRIHSQARNTAQLRV